MAKTLQLTRPLAVIDLETTGTDPLNDRIVEICVVKLIPEGGEERRCRLINPERPIPPEATAIHTITDDMVATAPTFARIASGLLDFLAGCDLCGYNLARFDLRMLQTEFDRCGKPLPLDGRLILDPMTIFHYFEKRDLTAAVKFYLNRDHAGAHRAEVDVDATIDILRAMLDRYPELPVTPEGMISHLKPKSAADPDGMLEETKAGLKFVRGKHRGKLLDDVARTERDYLAWMIEKGSFQPDTLQLVREALARGGN